ncbi:MAG: thiamine phosphate synthase [Vulcanimicrobiaceae bacterium]
MAAHEFQPVTVAPRAALLCGIYAIVDQSDVADPIAVAAASLQAGIKIVQYRAKTAVVPSVARKLRDMTRDATALFIVNDDWRTALQCDADGVHLGPGDPGFDDVESLRGAFGNRIVGLSCGTIEEARHAGASTADYVGVGPVYATASKSDAGDPLGLDRLARIAAATPLPVAAIGGITLATIAGVRAAGAAMAAVISALAAGPDPGATAAGLVAAWNAVAR